MRLLQFDFEKTRQINIVIILYLIALLVRIIGINYGYWFADERIDSAAKALSGDLVPGQHFYPPFLHYLTAVFFGVLYVLGRLFVSWYDIAEFKSQYFTDPTPFYITARFAIGLISAAIAPLFYLVARECGLNKRYAFIVGLFGVLIPGMVLLSHISKGDVPLAVCVVLVFYLTLKKIKNPNSLVLDLCIGLSIALALSFKQSYIFILFPFFACYLLIFYFEHGNLQKIVKSTLISIVVTIVFWCLFNIGILLDFANFLDFQKIQTVMSIREDKKLLDGVSAWWDIVADPFLGVNILVILVSIFSPLIIFLSCREAFSNTKKLLLCFWFSLVIGSFVVMYLSGSRQQSGLWVPYMTGIQLLMAISLCLLAQMTNGIKPLIAKLSILVCISFSIYGVYIVDKQAILKPIVIEVEDLLRSEYGSSETKILTSFTLRSPQTVKMKQDEYSRHERIAEKYSVVMPERAIENTIYTVTPKDINYMNMPTALYGLENTDDSSLGEVIKPYAWPLQVNEWQLDYWLDQGYEVFILADHDYALNKSNVELIKNFHHQIKDSCRLVKHFDPVKPLYIEFSATIYHCSL